MTLPTNRPTDRPAGWPACLTNWLTCWLDLPLNDGWTWIFGLTALGIVNSLCGQTVPPYPTVVAVAPSLGRTTTGGTRRNSTIPSYPPSIVTHCAFQSTTFKRNKINKKKIMKKTRFLSWESTGSRTIGQKGRNIINPKRISFTSLRNDCTPLPQRGGFVVVPGQWYYHRPS